MGDANTSRHQQRIVVSVPAVLILRLLRLQNMGHTSSLAVKPEVPGISKWGTTPTCSTKSPGNITSNDLGPPGGPKMYSRFHSNEPWKLKWGLYEYTNVGHQYVTAGVGPSFLGIKKDYTCLWTQMHD